MAINLSPTPAAVQVSSTPALHEWSFNPTTITVNYYQGSALPAPVTVATVFKDILGTDLAVGYTNFRYKLWPSAVSGLQLIDVSGTLYTGETESVSYNNGLSADMLYTFQNLHLLAPGTYTANINHHITARDQYNLGRSLSYYIYPVTIRVFSATAPTITPSAVSYQWAQGTTTAVLVSTFDVTGSAWAVTCPENFYLSSTTPGVLISQDGRSISGSGPAVLGLLMFPAAVPAPLVQNPFTIYLEVNGGLIRIPIKIGVTLVSGLFLETNTLFFEAQKGITEAEPASVAMHLDAAYTLTLPVWLQASPLAGSGSLTVSFSPISANNMSLGTYTGTVLVKRTDTGAVVGEINVTYAVMQSVMIPYGSKAFTLDPLFIEFVSAFPDTYFTVALGARVFNFDGTFQDKTLNFKVPLFRGSQKLNIGWPIDRLMANMNDLMAIDANGYTPAQVMMVITEQRGSESRVYNFGPISFIAGLRPALVMGNGFLDINAGARRVTPSSYQIVNMIIEVSSSVRIFRNGHQVSVGSYGIGIRVFKLDFAQLNAAPGDVFEVRQTTRLNVVYNSKLFKVMPEGYYSNYITWENEYKLQSMLECTGTYQITSELKNRTQELELGLRTVLDKIESTKTAKLTINTGWLLKSDIPSIESLMRSPRAVMMIDGKQVNLVPTSEKIINVDSERALVSFDLEFQINRNYNEEIYSY